MKKGLQIISQRKYRQQIVICFRGLIFLFFLFLVFQAKAQKTDILILNNGDKITGDFKRMEMGSVTIKTDAMGTINVDWTQVTSLRTKKTFEIRMASGMLYYASFDTTSRPGKVALVTQFEPEYEVFYVDVMKIVRITRLKDVFWRRFSGNYSIGFGLSKGDKQSKFNFNAITKYTSKKYLLQLDLNSNRSNSGTSIASINQNAQLTYSRYLGKKWAYGSSVNVEQNTEMGLDLRILLALQAGLFIIQTNLQRLIVAGGFQGTREKNTDSSTKNNIEGILEARYDIYKFQHPQVNVTASAAMYPSISEIGRLRSSISLSTSVELFKNFYFTLGGYFKSDNRPAENASSTDYNVSTSISFNF